LALELDPERNGSSPPSTCRRVEPEVLVAVPGQPGARLGGGGFQLHPAGHRLPALLHSLQELLAFELRGFVAFDVDQHKLQLDDGVVDVDIVVPALGLVVEFDGAFWHRAESPVMPPRPRGCGRLAGG
jgi:hypothetical protein